MRTMRESLELMARTFNVEIVPKEPLWKLKRRIGKAKRQYEREHHIKSPRFDWWSMPIWQLPFYFLGVVIVSIMLLVVSPVIALIIGYIIMITFVGKRLGWFRNI